MTPEEQARREGLARLIAAREEADRRARREQQDDTHRSLLEQVAAHAQEAIDPFDDPKDEARAEKFARASISSWPTLSFDQRLVIARLMLLGRPEDAAHYGALTRLLNNPNRHRRIQDLGEGETW